MIYHCFSSSLPDLPLLLYFSLFFIIFGFPLSLSDHDLYQNCRDAVFKCGNISTGFPFFGGQRAMECGRLGLELRCDNKNTTTIVISDIEYRVLAIHRDRHILRIARQDLIKYDGLCSPQIIPTRNSVLDSELFSPGLGYANVTLFYDCQSSISSRSTLGFFPCDNAGSTYSNVSVATRNNIRPKRCSANVTVPILRSSLEGSLNSLLGLKEALKRGVEVQWYWKDSEACGKCNDSGGACGFFGPAENQTVFCYCPFMFDNTHDDGQCIRVVSSPSPTTARGKGECEGLTVAVTITVVLVSAIFFFVLRLKGTSPSSHLWKGKKNDNARIEEFIAKFGSLAPNRYFYGDIKKMTNKFKDKLGKGGYGSVYKGKLPDGRLVAVKILSEFKDNGEEFMNEVASISRTSHVNIVTLLGFCFERSKRALVYEFMPNGSLDGFIYNKGLHSQSCQLEWKTLYNIAIGIARGLEYLHQGCNTRILHFDIKPHNILLDENFCPKISDFGLSKLCERKESIIANTGTRGTVGYIAPEVFCRNFGGVSHKSDVYSYGMMLLEMIGGRKNTDIEGSQTSETYFPSWINNHLDQPMNFNLNEVIAKEEEEITKKLVTVSLWCTQTNPIDRPSITKVLEMLQGNLQSLVLPSQPT
ncbi:LEAF RUST 10 DISEASE-RESISTANCE LOCUS RECEPTOR-LIKE PROTEIN KINASE-like 2.4 [Gossypium australe]|uniref:non-specific serine/threonine protein kinase n=1 Tax=Gossypium australe TaxID=47621 RepID=A0A5B6W084_9ROSI|nr:LEAF RUST 10 DISEASE-RESISTANCE LOCUS RECEPTOR-LIKE PROTEIN KINASE-like 2.4 [Gossypium australe]